MRYVLAFALWACAALADPVEIVEVVVTEAETGWRFAVTVRHPDTGWDHYADGWRVETEDGTVLGTRLLAHPHVEEQPFTRSLTGVDIPEGIGTVYIRAKCSVEGWGDTRVQVALGGG